MSRLNAHLFEIVSIVLLSTCVTVAQDTPGLKSLYDGHRWFQLRDALNRSTESPTLFRGTVAAAFNESRQAEKLLQPFIKASAQSLEADEARSVLIYLYFRAGRYRHALELVDEVLAVKPDDAGAKGFRALVAVLAEHPEQSTSHRRFSKTGYHLVEGNISIPLSVGGKSAEYIVDTDANISMLGESEAKRLGLTVREVSSDAIKLSGATGGMSEYRIAVADQLTVGNVHLKHVAFVVLRDDQKPFVDLPTGKRGILGLPVLLAFETMRWGANGGFEISFRPGQKNTRESNLCFDSSDPITEGEYQGRGLDFILDTGSENTDFWPPFAKDFLSNELGKKGSWRVTGVEGSKEFDSTILPEVKLRVGGFETVLPSAHVLLTQTGANSQWFYGRIGMSTLAQAHRVTIDFKAMTLRLE